MLISRAYKVQLYPNREQEAKMLAILEGTRWVYNHFLEQRKKHYLENHKTLPYREMARELTKVRRTTKELKDIQAEPLQQALRRLDGAYNRFFRKTHSFPRFKSQFARKQSFQKHQDWRLKDNKIQVQKDLLIKFKGFIDKAEYGTLVVTHESTGNWFASVTATIQGDKTARKKKPIGIDVGIETLATLSTGEKFANIRPQKTLQEKLTKAQRNLKKKVKGSKRHQKAKLEIARIYKKIADIRGNHIHQTSRAIVNKNASVIAIEDLDIKKMMGGMVARSLADASLGEFLRQIKYKQEWSGGKVVEIDRYFPSSKTCSKCGFILESLPLSKRTWECPECGAKHDRDINAAKNILKQALVGQ